MAVPSYLRYTNQGATRNQHLAPDLVNALSFLGDLGITAEVFSGGQPGKGSGGARVGSTRHDHGNAADVRFFQGDRRLDWANPQDLPLFEQIVSQGRKAGLTGFGAGPGYMGAGTMHVGFGSPGVWGAGGKAANAPEWLRNAYNGSSSPAGGTQVASASGAISDILGTSAAPQSAMAYGGDTVAQGGRMGGLGGLGGFTPPSQDVGLDTGAILRALGAGLIAGDASAVPAYLQQAIADQQRNVDRDYEREWQQYAFRTGLEDNELTRQQQREQVDYTRSQDAITNDYRERQLAASMLPKPEAPTALMQNLAAAGLQPGSPEYQQAVLSGTQGGTNVTLNTGEGNKFYETLDTEQAKTFSALSEEGVRGRGKLAQIDTLEGLLNQAQTGGWAVLKQAAGEYGINTEGLSDIQSAQALINELVPQQRQPGSGPMSDADLALFKQSLPRLINQPGGNQTIINTMRGITRYQVQMGEIADAVADRALTPAQAREQIRSLANPLEGFRSPGERQPADTTPREDGVPVGGQTPVMAGAGVQAEANGTMPMIRTQEQFDALPSGATFVAPDGNIRRKP